MRAIVADPGERWPSRLVATASAFRLTSPKQKMLSGIKIGPVGCLCVPKIIDIYSWRTDAGCELRCLPHATEEDDGAHPFKDTGGNCCAHLRGSTVCFGDPGQSDGLRN